MEEGSLNTPALSQFSSQESTSFARPVDDNFRLDDADISELLNQLYDLAQVSNNSVIYFNHSRQQIHKVKFVVFQILRLVDHKFLVELRVQYIMFKMATLLLYSLGCYIRISRCSG